MEQEKDGRSINVKSLKKEMDEFKADVGQKFDTVKNLLEEIVNKDKKANDFRDVKTVSPETLMGENGTYAPTQSTPVVATKVPLLPEQREIFEKYFDPMDGFKAEYIPSESSFLIEVPNNLSNCSEAYLQFYKKDIRCKKVDQNDPLGSIDRYCKLVAQNLKYDKKIKIKI